MQQKVYHCSQGAISYWINNLSMERETIVFLPGLTADHRLFDKQVDYFESRYNVVVWDAPGHGASRPFSLSFSLEDKVRWLHEILCTEGVEHPILVGQSMGGYVAQM
ncbi:MAG: alpha/beta hydrolase, partial [Paludibacteraceae bacterium]|nr:alpha/beta hydrolase [Paludibacteraceae bacterium]